MRKLITLLLAAASAHGAARNGRLLFGSCNKHDRPQPLWPKIHAREPQAWIWAGDIIYGDRMRRLLPFPRFEALGVDYLVRAYAAQNAVEGYAALAARVPVVATWDDHDFGLNDADASLPFKDASRAAFLDALNVTVPADRDGVYNARTVELSGGTVRVVALDMRFNKTPYAGRAGAGDFLGAKQWAWFEAEVAAADADAVVVVSSLQALEWRYGVSESWGRFPAARDRFLNVLAKATRPVLVVSGDVHLAEIGVAVCGAKRLVDVTSSGMTHSWRRQTAFPAYTVAPVLTAVMRVAQLALPHRYQATAETTGRRVFLDLNFGELDFDFEKRTVTARVFSRDGVELDATFALDALGVAGACAPLRGDVPRWRYAAQFAAWAALAFAVVAGYFVALPLAIASVVAKRVLAARPG